MGPLTPLTCPSISPPSHWEMGKSERRKRRCFSLQCTPSFPICLSKLFSPCWENNDIGFQSGLITIITCSMGTERELRLLPNQVKSLAQQALSGNSSITPLICLPHFVIAGFPKSATTSLANALFRHALVSSAPLKESHWWTRAPIISNAELLQLNVI